VNEVYTSITSVATYQNVRSYISVDHNPNLDRRIDRDALLCFQTQQNNVLLEKCIFLGYYAASSGNSSPTYRDNLSVQTSSVKNQKESL